ncbi:MAG: hypothetical protein Q7S31_03710 [bacterium]|nr:hypothetical protein [bacterium]
MASLVTEAPLNSGLNREVSLVEAVELARLVSICLLNDVSFTVGFETGRFIPGNLVFSPEGKFILPDEQPAENIRQGPQGITVEVSGSQFTDEAGQPKLYPSIREAVRDGLKLAYHSIAASGGDKAATEVFQQFFTTVNTPSSRKT